MLRITLILVLIVAYALAVSCSDSLDPTEVTTPIELDLKYGHSLSLDGGELTVSFVGAVDDSRCPADVICFWEGAANIHLAVKPKGGHTQVLKLTVRGDAIDTVQALNYRIDTLGYSFSLRRLNPFPERHDVRTPLSDYVARLMIAPLDDLYGAVVISDEPWQDFILGEYFVDSAVVVGDSLSVRVAYGGGCLRHDFRVFMSPGVFAESNPVQADLYLQHIDRHDACQAFIHEKRVFDLAGIGDLYRQTYGVSGIALLNLHEYRNGEISEGVTVEYTVP